MTEGTELIKNLEAVVFCVMATDTDQYSEEELTKISSLMRLIHREGGWMILNE